MFFVYVIKSEKNDFYYKGHCEDIGIRLLQHNSGMTESIKPYVPFELVYFERFETRQEAVSRENILKQQLEEDF